MKKLIFAAGFLSLVCLLGGCNEHFVDMGSGNRGKLSSVRSALQVYYGDNNGMFPDRLEELTKDSKYLSELPKLKIPGHSETNEVLYLDSPVIDPKLLTDTGGYVYFNSKKYPQIWGNVSVNCTHEDIKGESAYSW